MSNDVINSTASQENIYIKNDENEFAENDMWLLLIILLALFGGINPDLTKETVEKIAKEHGIDIEQLPK